MPHFAAPPFTWAVCSSCVGMPAAASKLRHVLRREEEAPRAWLETSESDCGVDE